MWQTFLHLFIHKTSPPLIHVTYLSTIDIDLWMTIPSPIHPCDRPYHHLLINIRNTSFHRLLVPVTNFPPPTRPGDLLSVIYPCQQTFSQSSNHSCDRHLHHLLCSVVYLTHFFTRQADRGHSIICVLCNWLIMTTCFQSVAEFIYSFLPRWPKLLMSSL